VGSRNWILAAVVGLVALLILLVVASMFSPGSSWPGGMMGPGMMGGWGMLGWMWMLLIPVTIVVVLVVGLVWLAQQITSRRNGGYPVGAAVPCPQCGLLVQVGWRACPYCGRTLVTDGPPDEAAS
jgi:uncharacterized membrane protein